MLRKVVPVTGFKVIDDEQGIAEAIVSVTGVEDEVRDVIHPGAYEKTLKARKPKGAWAHNWDQPVSKTLEAVELMPGDSRLPTETRSGEPWPAEAGGLLVVTQYNLSTQRGREAYEDAKFFGEDQEWSIGFNIPVGGSKMRKNGIRDIFAVDLFEYSQVLFGAMPLTGTVGVKDAQQAFKAIVAEAGVPHEFRSGEGDLCLICEQADGTKGHIAPTGEAPVVEGDEDSSGGAVGGETPEVPATAEGKGAGKADASPTSVLPTRAQAEAAARAALAKFAVEAAPEQVGAAAAYIKAALDEGDVTTPAGPETQDEAPEGLSEAPDANARPKVRFLAPAADASPEASAELLEAAFLDGIKAGTAEKKVYAPLTGSFEHVQEALRNAIRGWIKDQTENDEGGFLAGSYWRYYGYPEGTFDDRVVFAVIDFTDDYVSRYFEAPYTFDGSTATLGEVREVEIEVGVRAKSLLRAIKAYAADSGLEDLLVKEGRVLSKTNESTIKAAVDALIGVLDAAGVDHGYSTGEKAIVGRETSSSGSETGIKASETPSGPDADERVESVDDETAIPVRHDEPELPEVPEGKALITEAEILLAQALALTV